MCDYKKFRLPLDYCFKLKELGYSEESLVYTGKTPIKYGFDYMDAMDRDDIGFKPSDFNDPNEGGVESDFDYDRTIDNIATVPTFSEVHAWLEEEKGIFIYLSPGNKVEIVFPDSEDIKVKSSSHSSFVNLKKSILVSIDRLYKNKP